MSQSLWRLPQPARLIALPLVRGRLKLRGRPPGQALSLEERLARLAPPRAEPINLGFRYQPPQERAHLTRIARLNNKNRQLEYAARERTLKIPLDQVEAEWQHTHGPIHMQRLAEHYGLFRDLFGDESVFFTPVVPLRIEYPIQDSHESSEELCSVVHFGNDIKPAEASVRPDVVYEAGENSLWTLMCVNCEGNGEEPQIVHWLVQNIPGCDIPAGQELVPYLQPLPYRGTGYHRIVFLLFKQDNLIAAPSPSDGVPLPGGDPALRGFSTEQFYRCHEQQLTPAGLAFFQSDWDQSVTKHFHQQLQRPEPIFEFEQPPPYVRRQRWFPKGESVNRYFDKYADPRDLQKQMLLKRLAMVHPFKGVDKGPRWPLAIRRKPEDRPVSWIINEERKEFRRVSKYYFIDRHPETLFDPKH